jgi:hypothetical protein
MERACALVLAIQLGKRSLDRERRSHCALGIFSWATGWPNSAISPCQTFWRAHLCHRGGSGVEISADGITSFFGVQLAGDASRIYQTAEHHCDLPAVTNRLGGAATAGLVEASNTESGPPADAHAPEPMAGTRKAAARKSRQRAGRGHPAPEAVLGEAEPAASASATQAGKRWTGRAKPLSADRAQSFSAAWPLSAPAPAPPN